jgi:hypothetical protein
LPHLPTGSFQSVKYFEIGSIGSSPGGAATPGQSGFAAVCP